MKPIILATTSKYKIELFHKLGFAFQTAKPQCEEVLMPGQRPEDQAARLSEEKAKSLEKAFPNHWVIGADQVLALGQEIFTKPGSVEKAVAQVLRLSGRSHALHTAYTLLDTGTGRIKSRVVTSRLRLRSNLNPSQVEALIRLESSEDCVGGYKFESRGIQWMTAVHTPDPNAIVGLPLIALGADIRRWIMECESS